MSDIAIRVEGLSKAYRIGLAEQRHETLMGAFTSFLKSPIQNFRNLRKLSRFEDVKTDHGQRTTDNGPVVSGQSSVVGTSAVEVSGQSSVVSSEASPSDVIWALRDVSFEVKHGEAIGIIGRNGAGKSTLLKILSRITEPTSGRAEINGRVGSLLEVGTGFHPDLTGRENIYLNGTILGMKKREVDAKFDEIVEFSGVEKFVDTPVKRYSSGMRVRLAFSVAAYLEPEIMIIDEVLAVGDAEFQKKCLGKMKDVSSGGRTVLFVSHNMQAIRTLCSRGLLLEAGSSSFLGPALDCILAYESTSDDSRSNSWSRPQGLRRGALTFESVTCSLDGRQPHLKLLLDIEMRSHHDHKSAFLAVDILESAGTAIMQAIPSLEAFVRRQDAPHRFRLGVDLPPLIPGRYAVTLWAGPHNSQTLDQVQGAICFEIHESPTSGRTYPHHPDHGHIVPHSACVTTLP